MRNYSFQRLPQFRHVTKVVMGSSALRVCICVECRMSELMRSFLWRRTRVWPCGCSTLHFTCTVCTVCKSSMSGKEAARIPAGDEQ